MDMGQTTRERVASNITFIRSSYFPTEEEAMCMNNLSLQDAKNHLKGYNIFFIGDSLMRNFFNAFVSVWRLGDNEMVGVCNRGSITKSVDAFVRLGPSASASPEQPIRIYRDEKSIKMCEEVSGWESSRVLSLPGGVSTQFLWLPHYPSFKPGNESNCTGGLDEFTTKYLFNQYRNACNDLEKQLLTLENASIEGPAIYVVNLPVLTSSHSEYLRTHYLDLLRDRRGRVLFVSHLDPQHPTLSPIVRQVIENLKSRRVDFFHYGHICIPPFWYDAYHVHGPVQRVATAFLLRRLAQLSSALPPRSPAP